MNIMNKKYAIKYYNGLLQELEDKTELKWCDGDKPNEWVPPNEVKHISE